MCAQLQDLSTSGRAQDAREEKKETAHSQGSINIYLLYIRLTMKNLIGREHSINSQ